MPDTAVIAESPAGTPATSEPAQGSAPQSAPSSTSTSAAPASAPTGQYTYKEDRTNWVPPHRLREETQKRQSQDQELASLRAQVQQEQQRVRVLAGVETPDKSAADQQQILEALVKVAPQLSPLLRLSPDQVEEFFGSIDNAKQTNQHVWTNYGNQTLSNIWTKLGEVSGGALTTDEQEQVREDFIQYLSASDQRRERYEGGDPKVIEEFVSRMSRWVDRGRRLSTSTTAQRVTRPIPSGRGGTAPVTTTQRAKIKPGDFDALLDQATGYLQERGIGLSNDR